MLNGDDFVKAIKRVAIEAVYASKPSDIVFGKVINENPLKIKVDQKLILTEKQLVLSRDVTDYEIEMEPTPSHLTETSSGGSGESSFASHTHEYKGRKKFKVYNALKTDEKVIMARMYGGQQYIVIDRIGKG